MGKESDIIQVNKEEEKKHSVSAHVGHRERMRNRFRSQGIDRFEDHEVLEMLLYFAIPQKNTNEMAHILLNRFGSISGVLDAPETELKKVPGIGEAAAMLLKFVPQLFRRYSESSKNATNRILTYREAAEYLQPKFFGRENEVVFLMLMDPKGKLLYCDMVNEGSVNACSVYVRDVVRLALQYNALSAVLAHNHPSGNCLPSAQDIATTRTVANALSGVDVVLMDHVIFSNPDYLSLAQSGFMEDLFPAED